MDLKSTMIIDQIKLDSEYGLLEIFAKQEVIIKILQSIDMENK